MKARKILATTLVLSLIISNIFLTIKVYQLQKENEILKEGLRDAIWHIFDFIKAIKKYYNDTELLDYITESNMDFWNWYWQYKHLLQ